MPATIPVVDADAARAFLQAGRLAVVGASDAKESMGRTVYTELRSHGIDAVAVHRTAATVAGDPCYPSLDAVPGELAGAIVMVGGPAAAEVVREAAARGIPRVWLYFGFSKPGSATPEALAAAEELGLEVVPGACPLMFLEPTAFIHRFHRGIRRMRGHVTAG
ncbi:MAG TPA: CoA-binding protein [Acidimicrobiales bacterium]|nr:CoA-binding protein [Acidimicrobiales bacterium]